MVKNIFITTLITILSISAFSQRNEIRYNLENGPILKTKKRSSVEKILGHDNSGYYALVSNRGSLYLENYTYALNLRKSERISFYSNNKYYSFNEVVLMDSHIYLMAQAKNKKDKVSEFFIQKIDKQSLTAVTDFIKLGEIDEKLFGVGSSINLINSEDQKTSLIVYKPPYKRNEDEKLIFQVLDENMREVWQKEIQLNISDKMFSVYDYTIDNKGNAYLLGKVYEGNDKDKIKHESNYNFKIYSYLNDGKTVNEYDVNIGTDYITDMKLEVNQAGKLVCAGFYSELGESSIKGTYYLDIDTEKGIITNQHKKEFGMDFITQYMSSKQKKKTNKKINKGKDIEMYNYYLDDLVSLDDGSTYLIGEQFREWVTYTTTYNSNGTTSTITNYHYLYGDLIVSKFSPDGKIEWIKKIPKSQYTSNDGGYYSSYVKAVIGNNLFFVFNDHANNLYLKENQTPVNMSLNKKTASVSIVGINEKGDIKKQSLFGPEKLVTITVPKVCEQISEKEILVYCKRGKKVNFSKVTF